MKTVASWKSEALTACNNIFTYARRTAALAQGYNTLQKPFYNRKKRDRCFYIKEKHASWHMQYHYESRRSPEMAIPGTVKNRLLVATPLPFSVASSRVVEEPGV
jgi:hypothetical protein